MKKEMEKSYNPHVVEDRIYADWLEKGYFRAITGSGREPYTIAIPPPNITSQLHMGHAFDCSILDILIRFKRMQGREALCIPGTDHASIATEVMIIKAMAQEGLTKEDIGREGFLERAWKWYDKYGSRIVTQLKKMGSSFDWDKLRFTMDDGLSKAVTEFFVRLHEKGYIYRGEKLCNWCSYCQTTISDAEVDHTDREAHLYYLQYQIKGTDKFIQFATTRPETILADTAVAVNPCDERYAGLVGKTCLVPFANREIKIIADDYVDAKYGSGAVKITPGHDHNDFAVGERHNLERINILNDDGTLNEQTGCYEGLTVKAARERILKDLEALGLYVKSEKLNHSVGTHDRCKDVVEPRLKTQWFVRMEELAKPALEAFKSGELRIQPERFAKIYLHWLTNIRDWCVSRQLWWGHRIPAWYCACGEITVARTAPENCPMCGSVSLNQEEDILDTWFSSALWPFSTLGWPDKTPDFDYFYPTTVMSMGWEILFFWGVRMVFSGIELTGALPFKDMIIHGMVLDQNGVKMSKSLGNGIDPLEMISKYGTDALRLSLITGNTPGADFRFREEKITSCRNFCNKIWNAARFILMNTPEDFDAKAAYELTDADKWLISHCNRLSRDVTNLLDSYDLGLAASKVYDFIWDEFCDWAIEMAKPRLIAGDKAALWTLRRVFFDALRLLHPFMPFVTEEVFQSLQSDEETIMRSAWPVYNDENNHTEEEHAISAVKEAVKAVRSIRAEKDVPPSRKVQIFIVSDSREQREIFTRGLSYLKTLSSAQEIFIDGTKCNVPENALSVVITNAVIYIPLSDLIDAEKELARLNKEKVRLESEVTRCESRLANKGFTDKAKPELVAAEAAKLDEYKNMLSKVTEEISKL
ncbi:MAG: valine--tRNA ligase [Defluviitaleaceae bacterium]|nr:valine--tRNA ligase [Defluviitaleaceae bacterium]